MASIDEKKEQPARDMDEELSDAASSHLDVQSLKDEDLPGYSDEHHAPPPMHTAPPPEDKSAPTGRQRNASHSLSPVAPTASAPFNFPTDTAPPYEANIDIVKPIAIPQASPAPDAPFLDAYPPQLLTYGVPEDSWNSFIDTLSAFVSANVSQQAVHHAADIGNQIGDYHKQYAKEAKQRGRDIGASAKRLNPFGVIGGAVGITMHFTGHVVGSIFQPMGSVVSKPKTPRERATAYVSAANKKWFHGRGLHALLVDTAELASLLNTSYQELVAATHRSGLVDTAAQMKSLTKWLADIEIRKDRDPSNQSTKLEPLNRLGPSGSRSTSFSDSARSQSILGNAGKRPWRPQLELVAGTLWLVITQKDKIEQFDPNSVDVEQKFLQS